MTNTNTANNQLENPATISQIENLYARQIIDGKARNEGLIFLNGPHQWHEWISRTLFILGSALILAGIVYFFAFNWAEMSKWSKFALIETSIILCLIGTTYFTTKHFLGQTLLFSASLLTGVLLAIFGQTYQTGADNVVLFLTWAALILPWTILSKSPANWALWLIISNIAISLLWQDSWIHSIFNKNIEIEATLALFNSIALTTVLIARNKNISWLKENWFLYILSAAVIFLLITIVITWIDTKTPIHTLTSAIAISALIGQAIIFYATRWKWPNYIILSMLTLGLAIELEYLMINRLFKHTKWDVGAFFTSGLLTLIIFTICVAYLRYSHKQLEANNA